MGAWDGIAVRAGAFAGFYPLGGSARTDYAAARVALGVLLNSRDPRLHDAMRPGRSEA